MQDDDRAFDWIGQLAHHAGPRYLQIAGFIERALADGRLKPGDRLPPQRRLAEFLKVDLTTVTRAYDEARRRNLLIGQGARGTYAAAPKVALTQFLDLSMNIPPPPAGVDFDDLLKQGMSQVLMHTDSGLLMNYHRGGGSDADRAAGAAWLAPMLGTVHAQDIVVCPGAQSALAALVLALSRPGEAIVAEAIVYPGLRTAVNELGRRLLPVAVDQHGMLPAALEQACIKGQQRGQRRVAMVYLNPTLQNPTTRTMPEARRRAILAVAERCGVQIVEDDPYWLLADAATVPPPLARLAPHQVHYISTLSKCLAPGLRTAYVVPSDAAMRERFMAALRSFALMSSPLPTALGTQWIHDGSAQRLLDGVKQEARLRQQLAHQLLAGHTRAGADGIHIWLELPGYWTARALAQAAAGEGLAVTPSDAFSGGRSTSNAIRIALGAIRDSARLAAALRKLSELLARRPAAPGAPVV